MKRTLNTTISRAKSEMNNVRYLQLADTENRVCGYALTNSLGRSMGISLSYDGSYLTNMVYALPNGGG